MQYNATRRAVLAGADGVVFVADSQRAQAKANDESLANLAENLRPTASTPRRSRSSCSTTSATCPTRSSRAELDKSLNGRGLQAFETVATTGAGVIEGFAAITEATVRRSPTGSGCRAQPDALQRLVANVHTALQPLTAQGDRVAPPEAAGGVAPGGRRGQDLNEDELRRRGGARQPGDDRPQRAARPPHQELERRVAKLRAINEFGRLMSLAREPEEVTSASRPAARRAQGRLRLAAPGRPVTASWSRCSAAAWPATR